MGAATLPPRLLYRGQIFPYCPRCGTALSDHEVKQGYEDVRDPSVYLALELEGTRNEDRGSDVASALPRSSVPGPRRVLVWTTTPWTLVSNVALAVNPELAYIELVRRERESEGTIILAEARAATVLGEDWPDRGNRAATGRNAPPACLRRPLYWFRLGGASTNHCCRIVRVRPTASYRNFAPAFGADDYGRPTSRLAFSRPSMHAEFPADCRGGAVVKDVTPDHRGSARRGRSEAGTIGTRIPIVCDAHTADLLCRGPFVRTTAYRYRMLAATLA